MLWAAMLWLGGGGTDERLLMHMRAQPGSPLAEAARWITPLGGGGVLLPVAALAALGLVLRRRAWEAMLLVAALLSCRLLVSVQKMLVARPRPPLDLHLVEVSSTSFPSAHAANSAATLACLLLFLPGARRPPVVAATALLALAIGLSRPVLGVHWPSDVVGGCAFGLAWALVWAATTRRRLSPS